MATIAPFTNGYKVAHRLSVPGSPARFSAWYDTQGQLIDAERIDRRGTASPVNEGGFQWRYLANLGPAIIRA